MNVIRFKVITIPIFIDNILRSFISKFKSVIRQQDYIFIFITDFPDSSLKKQKNVAYLKYTVCTIKKIIGLINFIVILVVTYQQYSGLNYIVDQALPASFPLL